MKQIGKAIDKALDGMSKDYEIGHICRRTCGICEHLHSRCRTPRNWRIGHDDPHDQRTCADSDRRCLPGKQEALKGVIVLRHLLNNLGGLWYNLVGERGRLNISNGEPKRQIDQSIHVTQNIQHAMNRCNWREQYRPIAHLF